MKYVITALFGGGLGFMAVFASSELGWFAYVLAVLLLVLFFARAAMEEW